MPRIAIIAGAGPAGLTAAYELLKRTDIIPIVCEETDVIGGIAQTFNFKGNRIDIGGHRFFSKSDRIMNWWFNILPRQGKAAADTVEKKHDIEYATEAIIEYLCKKCMTSGQRSAVSGQHEMQITDRRSQIASQERNRESTIIRRPSPDPEKEDLVMLQRPRISRIFFKRFFFPYPIGITLLVAKRLGFINTALIGFSYIWRQMFPLKDETFLDAFYRNRFGDRLYRTFFEKYTEKVWGVPVNQIRADWGAQRVKGLSLKRALTHAVQDLFSSDFKKHQKERETSLITRFWYPKFGPGQMWEEVARQIRCCGGEIRMGTRVVGVHLKEGQVTSATLENMTTGATEQVGCDVFFSTMPLKHLMGMIAPYPPRRVIEVAEGLQYRDFLTIGLLLEKLHVQRKDGGVETAVPDNWIYIQEGDVRVGRVQLFNNWSPYMVADRKNTQWIGMEYFVNEGGDLWVMDDKDLIDLGIKEMETIGMIKREDVLDGCVLRIPKAYPSYTGSYPQLKVIREFLDAIPNLFPVGRNGMHRYNNQDHSMLTAMLAVDNIVAGRTDKSNLWNVNLEEEYHEEKNERYTKFRI
ncbi:MAG: NAD(P)/FAD-dependent oxidoreductase [Candidatus Peribacteraceae bacterium]|nr:NAD(P)/FAD-dependent oxidoreductase [Candidatus Peribacteraceae bacterium]